MCLQWEQSIAMHKRYLSAPRLIAELGGTARKFVVGKKPNWASFNGGVEYLMGHLRKHLGRPQIPELSEHLNKYFRQSRRQRHESMNSYIVRKTETYARARQALARVQSSFDQKYGYHGRRRDDWSSWQGSSWSRGSNHGSWWNSEEMWHDAYEEEASEQPGEAASVEDAAQPSAASWDEGRGRRTGVSMHQSCCLTFCKDGIFWQTPI